MFSIKGRIGRLEYIAHRLVAAVIILFGYVFAMLVSGTPFSEPITAPVPQIIVVVAVATGVLAVLTASVRRCHDLGHSGFLLILTVIPLVGQLFHLYLTVWHGQYGENKWGYHGGSSPHANGLSPRDRYLAEFG
ncbi:MAG: DUF805 domain-containing protein [Acidimicrobiales bacterium]|nr:DUF805 domain-containing protein [Acidimicrobiales bacterium]